jgi:hypothetical protein
MSELIAWTSDAYSSRQLHPLLVTAIFTVVLLEIHPFQDGNGRLSRILTTLLLLRAGYSYVPYSSLESVIEQSKEGYYLALRQTQVTVRTDAPNWQPWVMFFLRALRQQMKRLAKKSNGRRSSLRRCRNCQCASSSTPEDTEESPSATSYDSPGRAETRQSNTSASWLPKAILRSTAADVARGTHCFNERAPCHSPKGLGRGSSSPCLHSNECSTLFSPNPLKLRLR